MHPLLRAVAERRLGLFTAVDARRAGYEHDEIRRLRSSGHWVALRRGIYTTAENLAQSTSPRRRHLIDCLAVLLELDRPTATVSSMSAARAWGLPLRRSADPTVQLTHPTAWRHGRGFHMTRAPLHATEIIRMGPLPVTTMPRTLVDCARAWSLEDAVVAMDAALLAGRTSPTELRHALDGEHGWPGIVRAARAVALADGRAESPLETLGRLRIVGTGLPRPELQVEIRTAERLVAVVDGWFDEAAVAVEFDGRVKYTDPWRGRTPERVLWEEKRREDELRSLDIRVVRIADRDLALPGWGRIEGRLRELLGSAGPGTRSFTATPRDAGRQRRAG